MDHDSQLPETPGALVRAEKAAIARPKPRVLVYPSMIDVVSRPRVKGARLRTHLWSKRKIIGSSVLLGALLAAGISWTMPSVYQATALVSAGHAVDITLPGFEAISTKTSDDEYFSFQIELLLSSRVLDDAIRSGDANEDSEFARLANKRRFAPQTTQIDDSLTSFVRQRLTVLPHRESRSVEIQFRSSSAAGVASFSNAIATAYINASADGVRKKLEGIFDKLSERSFELANRASGAREQLLQYEKQHRGVVSRWRAQTLSGSAEQMGQRIAGVSSDRQALSEKIARLRTANSESELNDASAALAKTRAELAVAENDLAKMQGKYSPDYPPMKAAIDRVASLWQKFETERASELAELQRQYNESVEREASLKDRNIRPSAITATASPRSAEYGLMMQDYQRASDQYQELQRALGYMAVLTRLPLSQARIIDPAKPPARAVGPRRMLHIGYGTCAGLLLGLAIAWVQSLGARKISGPDDVEAATGLGTVGIIPKFEELRKAAASVPQGGSAEKNKSAAIPGAIPLSRDPQFIAESQIDEAFNRLRASLFSSATQSPPRVLLVTSAHAGEGKTTVAIKTAMSLARASLRVALVDCDLRRPSVHTVLGLAGHTGVATFLSTPMDEIWPLVNECRVGEHGTFHVIPSGDPVASAGDLVATARLRQFVEALRSMYDFVVIDSPPMSGMSDALLLSNFADSVLLVAQGEKTTAEDLRRVCLELEQMNASIFGVVLSQVDVLASKYYQAYYPADFPSPRQTT